MLIYTIHILGNVISLVLKLAIVLMYHIDLDILYQIDVYKYKEKDNVFHFLLSMNCIKDNN